MRTLAISADLIIPHAPGYMTLSQVSPSLAAGAQYLLSRTLSRPWLLGCGAGARPPAVSLSRALPLPVPSADTSSSSVCRKRKITPALETQPLL